MESINPRKVLKHLFSAFDDYPPDAIKIIVHTDYPYSYYISTNNNMFSVERLYVDEDDKDVIINFPDISNVNDFLSLLKNEKIVIIELETTPLRKRPINMIVFRCDHAGCYDQRNKHIKDNFKNSDLYARVVGHPELLRQEGFFNIDDIVSDVDFGKKRRFSPEIKYLKSF